MAKHIEAPPGIEIASLKGKGPADYDLMRPGSGTPWEDRGTLGTIVAFIKTCMQSLFSPARLMDQIRRPETPKDAAAFGMLCSAMWVIGLAIWKYWSFRQYNSNPEYNVDSYWYWITAFVECALIPPGVWLWLRMGSRLYSTIGATELRNAQPVLVYNLFGYSMGPSILALIPIYGQAIALVWIIADVIIAGRRRLYLKPASAFVDAIIVVVCALAIALGVYFAIHLILGGGIEKIAPPPTETRG